MKIAHKLATAGLLLASLAVVPATSASAHAPHGSSSLAADCWDFTDTTNNSDAYTVTGTFGLKTGIGAGCSNVTVVTAGQGFYAWCEMHNPSSGYTWVYGRLEGTQTMGWFSRASLHKVSGTLHSCV